MVLVVCIDDSNGLMFNNRRVSSDKAVIQNLLGIADEPILLRAYSAPLFQGFEDRITICESVPTDAGIYFAETGDFLALVDFVETLIVYKWNRRYPSDQKFPMDAFKNCMTLKNVEEFEGTSHPCITREVYVR